MKKRDLFTEMLQGVAEMAAHREGKITLRQFDLEEKPAPEVSASEIIALRKKLQMSQAVFARSLRTNPSTLRNWEQDKSKPNTQAVLLIKLVEQFPDMVERLETI
ncbi:MAG TPA: helix-turn-helix domain-containing protein [Pseudomonas sp.]|nr:helix-turn-helix domain-containing protein [Pseudomonas sp.]